MSHQQPSPLPLHYYYYYCYCCCCCYYYYYYCCCCCYYCYYYYHYYYYYHHPLIIIVHSFLIFFFTICLGFCTLILEGWHFPPHFLLFSFTLHRQNLVKAPVGAN